MAVLNRVKTTIPVASISDGAFKLSRTKRKAFGTKQGAHVFAFSAYKMYVSWLFEERPDGVCFTDKLVDFHQLARRECALNTALLDYGDFSDLEGRLVAIGIFKNHFSRAERSFRIMYGESESVVETKPDLFMEYLSDVSYCHNYSPCMVVYVEDARDLEAARDINRARRAFEAMTPGGQSLYEVEDSLRKYIDPMAVKLLFRHNESDIILMATLLLQIHKFIEHYCFKLDSFLCEVQALKDKPYVKKFIDLPKKHCDFILRVLHLDNVPKDDDKKFSFRMLPELVRHAYLLIAELKDNSVAAPSKYNAIQDVSLIALTIQNFIKARKGEWLKLKKEESNGSH